MRLVRDKVWRHGFLYGREMLRIYLLTNPGCELLLLDPEFPAPGPVALEAKAQIGVDLVPSAFTDVPEAPAMVRMALEVDPAKLEEES